MSKTSLQTRHNANWLLLGIMVFAFVMLFTATPESIAASGNSGTVYGDLTAGGKIQLTATFPEEINAMYIGKLVNGGDFVFNQVQVTEVNATDAGYSYVWKSGIAYDPNVTYDFMVQANAVETLYFAPGPDSQVYYRFDPLQARNLPSDGEILFAMGQDSDVLHDFKAEVLDVDPTFPVPAGVTLYTNAAGSPLTALWQAVSFGSGINDFQRTIDEYDGALLVGLYMADETKPCVPGVNDRHLLAVADDPSVDATTQAAYDQWVDELILYFKKTGRPVYLRIAYEFDGGWNCYTPNSFVEAFRNIKDRIDALGADNIATVWQATLAPEKKIYPYDVDFPGHYEEWYPGDAYVDWAGITTFQLGNYLDYQWACYSGAFTDEDPVTMHDTFLDFARDHEIPVLISESSPQAYDTGELSAACVLPEGEPWDIGNRIPLTAQEIWDSWYEPFFNYIDANKDVIRGVAYINDNWKIHSQWRCDADFCGSNRYWGDTRIQANPLILANFKAEVSKPIYNTNPAPSPAFEAPSFNPGKRIYEAEYAQVDFTWIGGPLGPDLGALTLPSFTASGNRHVMLLNHVPVPQNPNLIFENVRCGNRIKITYSATVPGATYSVKVNGKLVADQQPMTLTADSFTYTTDTINATVPWGADIEIILDNGSIIFWVDKIEVRW
ncbi:MAG: glycoside hydrolase family 26 protein [Pseudomonadales bacterium]|nr:glycoside hydrolase family 26 protein [Pseudomonadales bacterium]